MPCCIRPKNIARLIVAIYLILLPPLAYASALFFQNTVATFEPPQNTVVARSQKLAEKFLPDQVLKDPAFILVERKDGSPVVEVDVTNSSSDVCRFYRVVATVAKRHEKKGFLAIDGFCKYVSYPSIGKEFMSSDGKKTLIVANMESTSRKRSKWPAIEKALQKWLVANATGLKMRVTSEGQLLDETEDAVVGDLVVSDSISIPVALIILAMALRSFRQLIVAGLQIGLTMTLMFGCMYGFSTRIGISSFAPEGASSLIVALSIDYALFLSSRFNEQTKLAILDGEDILNDEDAQLELCKRVVYLCSHNILVSGFAIAISLGSLILMPVSLIATVGIAFTVGALCAILVAMTLTPAVLFSFFNFFAQDPGFATFCGKLGRCGQFFLDDMAEDETCTPGQLLEEKAQQERERNDEHINADLDPSGASEPEAVMLETVRDAKSAPSSSALALAAAAAAAGDAGVSAASRENLTEAQRREADRMELLADVKAEEQQHDVGARSTSATLETAAQQQEPSPVGVEPGRTSPPKESGGEVEDSTLKRNSARSQQQQQQQQQQRGSQRKTSTTVQRQASLEQGLLTTADENSAAAAASTHTPPRSPLDENVLGDDDDDDNHHLHLQLRASSPGAVSILSEEPYEEQLSPSIARRHQLARRAQFNSPWFKIGRFAVDNSCAVVIVILVMLLPFIAGVSLMDITFDLFAQVPRGSEKVKILDEVLSDIGSGAISAPFFVTIDTKFSNGLGSRYNGTLGMELGSLNNIEQLARILFKNQISGHIPGMGGSTSPPPPAPPVPSKPSDLRNYSNNMTGGNLTNMTWPNVTFHNNSNAANDNYGGFNATVFQAIQQFAVYIAGRTGIELDRITSYTSLSGAGLGFMAFEGDALLGCAHSQRLQNHSEQKNYVPPGETVPGRYTQIVRGCRAYDALVRRTIDPSFRVALMIIAPPFDSFGNQANAFLTLLSKAVGEFNKRQELFEAGFYGASSTDWQVLHTIIGVMPIQIGATLAVVFVIAFVTFKSVFIPLRMVLTMCVSLVVSFGTAVFLIQTPVVREAIWGENNPGALCWLIPTFAISLLVSLSVDYEIFALTRIFEFKRLGFSSRAATIKAVYKSGRIISYAAAVMAVAFCSMMFSSTQTLQQFGILATVAVLVDAFIVRTFLTPALTVLQIPEVACWWPTRFEEPASGEWRGLEDMTESTE